MSTGRKYDSRAQLVAVVATNDCPTGKQAHSSRGSAKKQAARVRASNGEHLRPYRCEHCNQWHVGHLPLAVMHGEVDADTYYGRTSTGGSP